MKKIRFIFKDGKVEVDAEGFQGKECIEVTEKILEPLRVSLEDRKLKKEYYKTSVATKEYEVD